VIVALSEQSFAAAGSARALQGQPQNTLVEDNPARIDSEPNDSGSSISVSFTGCFQFGGGQLPNGASSIVTTDSPLHGPEFGLGFTVFGSVPSGQSVAATYNTRLQTSEIKLGTTGAPASILSLTYNYGTTNNNGNIQRLPTRAVD
jgi:hypothetical protein